MKNVNDISIRSNLQERDNLLTIDKVPLTPECKRPKGAFEQFQGKEFSKVLVEDAAKNTNVGNGNIEPPILKNKSKSLRSIIECKIKTIPKVTESEQIKTSTFAEKVPKENPKEQAFNTKIEVRLPPGFITQVDATPKINLKKIITQQEKTVTQSITKPVLTPVDELKHGDKIELSPIIMKLDQESPSYFPIVELKDRLELGEFSPSRHFEENPQVLANTKKEPPPLKSRASSRNKRSDYEYYGSSESMNGGSIGY